MISPFRVFLLALTSLEIGTAVAQPSYPATEIPPVILRDTRPEEWPDLRNRIETRLDVIQGRGPAHDDLGPVRFDEIGRGSIGELTTVRYRYHVVDDLWTEAVLVIPADLGPGEKRSAVVTIHGTNGAAGSAGMLNPEGRGARRAYAVELARRGYVTLAPDLFGFGATHDPSGERTRRFYETYPEWHVNSLQVLSNQRALDLLDRLPMVAAGRYASIGNSLGGANSLRLAAADARIHVAVVSTGISPQATNIYRQYNPRDSQGARHRVDRIIQATGRPPYEVSDFLALCAPRAVLVIEPFDDNYNPDVTATFHAVRNAWHVWHLLGRADAFQFVLHGDRHDTTVDVRNAAYRWIEKWLPANPDFTEPENETTRVEAARTLGDTGLTGVPQSELRQTQR